MTAMTFVGAPLLRHVSWTKPACSGCRSKRLSWMSASSMDEVVAWDPEDNGFTHIGTVVGEHGIRGEVKVRSLSDFARQRLAVTKAEDRFLVPKKRLYPRPVRLLHGRKASQRDLWIVKLEGWDFPEQARELRGARLFIRQEERPKSIGRGEFLIRELVGMKCVSVEGDPIGVVSGVVTRDELPNATGVGNDTLEILLLDDVTRCLVPFVSSIVVRIDAQGGVLSLDPPDGLLMGTVVPKRKERRGPRGLLLPSTD